MAAEEGKHEPPPAHRAAQRLVVQSELLRGLPRGSKLDRSAELPDLATLMRELQLLAGDAVSHVASIDVAPDRQVLADSLHMMAVTIQYVGQVVSEPNPDKVVHYRSLLRHLSVVKHYAEQLAKDYAIEAVQASTISRKDAGEILGLHQGTIARWVKAAEHTD